MGAEYTCEKCGKAITAEVEAQHNYRLDVYGGQFFQWDMNKECELFFCQGCFCDVLDFLQKPQVAETEFSEPVSTPTDTVHTWEKQPGGWIQCLQCHQYDSEVDRESECPNEPVKRLPPKHNYHYVDGQKASDGSPLVRCRACEIESTLENLQSIQCVPVAPEEALESL